jgi:Gluconate 2-dehydrogenase subunit 3
MHTSSDSTPAELINRREAMRRISALLGGITFVGGSGLLAALENASLPVAGTPGEFSAENIAFLDEIAETILPETKTPGAKAAQTGAFMALMVTDSYSHAQQKIFREGMQKIEDATKKAHKVSFMQATAQQRLAVLSVLDREQKRVMDAREAAERKKKGLAALPGDETTATADAHLPDAQNEDVPITTVGADGVTIEPPAHYFRMMKELALLGYFTSELGCTKVLRYAETPGRFDPCIPYTPGEPAWAAHA